MLGDDARGVGSIWGRSGKKDESVEIFRKELDEMRAEHVKLGELCRVLDKDLASVEAAVLKLSTLEATVEAAVLKLSTLEDAVKKLTYRMNIVEPQEQEDFNKLRILESRINKLEAQMKSAV